jgi:Ca2+/Na+ antiporter
MPLPLPIRADILKTLMLEDRTEIRTIRLALYHTVSFVTVSSFVLAAFLANSQLKHYPIYALIDTLLLLIIWVVFAKLMGDLYHARQCQKLRERLVVALDTAEGETDPFRPFQSAEDEVPTVTDSELKWLPILATVAIMAKVVILAIILPHLMKA